MASAIFLVPYTLQNLDTSQFEKWGLSSLLLNQGWSFWHLWPTSRIWQQWCDEMSKAASPLKRDSFCLMLTSLSVSLSLPTNTWEPSYQVVRKPGPHGKVSCWCSLWQSHQRPCDQCPPWDIFRGFPAQPSSFSIGTWTQQSRELFPPNPAQITDL